MGFYLVSLYSYSPLDTSPVTVVIPVRPPENPGGIWGAWLSGFMFYVFGKLAWLLPLPVFHLTLHYIKKPSLTHRGRSGYGALVLGYLSFLFCSLLITARLPGGLEPDYPGGVLGLWLLQHIIRYAGEAGALTATGIFTLLSAQFIARILRLTDLPDLWSRSRRSETHANDA